MSFYSPDPGRAIIPILSCVLTQLCSRNDLIPLDTNCITKFHALKPPGISIYDYLDRISKYAACSGECFILSLIYIDRVIQYNHSNFVVNSLNVHRLLITSIMLAAKFFDDQYFNNAYYAKIGGVPVPEMNSLEIDFLFMINFNLFGSAETFRQYYIELGNHVSNSPCNCRHNSYKLAPIVYNGISVIYVNPSPTTYNYNGNNTNNNIGVTTRTNNNIPHSAHTNNNVPYGTQRNYNIYYNNYNNNYYNNVGYY